MKIDISPEEADFLLQASDLMVRQHGIGAAPLALSTATKIKLAQKAEAEQSDTKETEK